MKKRIFCLILVLCMALTLLPVYAFAATVVESGTCGDNLTWTLDSEGTLTISGTGKMEDYILFSDWYLASTSWGVNESIKKVILKEGVESIGDRAFWLCGGLTSVSIPNSVTSIGDIAFDSCSSLTSVNIPSSVTSIGGGAFSGCSSLTGVSIPGSVESIGDGAFECCSSLPCIDVAANNSSYCSVNGVMFSKDKTKLLAYPAAKAGSSYSVPNSVTGIVRYAFSGCSNLTSVSIPSSVTRIGECAFEYSSSLKSVSIPNSITSIEDGTFEYCSSLTNLNIPDSVTSIGGSAFSGCSSLTGVSIPNSVTSIGHWAFSGCSSLTSVGIPGSVKSVGNYAFSDCYSLTGIDVAADNSDYCSVGGVLFDKAKTELIQYPCSRAGSSYTIPSSVTYIWRTAFFGSRNLTRVKIPEGVTSIGDSAFSCCNSLTGIDVAANNNSYCSVNGALLNKAKTTLIQYPCGSTVTSFDIPDGVTSIGSNTFADCYTLSSVTIPDSVTSIGERAFRGCYNISEIVIPSGVKYIYKYTFGGCTGLKSIVIPATVTAIYEGAFSNCSSLKNVYFCGTEEQWNRITVDENNDCLKNASVTFNYVQNPFTDVAKGAAYYDAVLWGNSKGIVSGFTATEFRPNNTCTRAQVVTFLWRAAGSPEPTNATNPFKDVSAKHSSGKDNPFYKAILWGVENGITSGYSDGTFRPNDTVTRAQFVTFLWRFEGQPTSSTALTFKDTSTIAKGYRDAVAWGVENGVIAGYGDNTFRPNATCTRWQVVLFMYRDMK